MDASCTIQDSIHVFSLVHKYVSSILGTYQACRSFSAPDIVVSYRRIAVKSPHVPFTSREFQLNSNQPYY